MNQDFWLKEIGFTAPIPSIGDDGALYIAHTEEIQGERVDWILAMLHQPPPLLLALLGLGATGEQLTTTLNRKSACWKYISCCLRKDIR